MGVHRTKQIKMIYIDIPWQEKENMMKKIIRGEGWIFLVVLVIFAGFFISMARRDSLPPTVTPTPYGGAVTVYASSVGMGHLGEYIVVNCGTEHREVFVRSYPRRGVALEQIGDNGHEWLLPLIAQVCSPTPTGE